MNEEKPPFQIASNVVKKSANLLTLQVTKLPKKQRYCKSIAVKMLEELSTNEAKRRYPTVPYLAPRIYKDNSTNELTKCVVDFLRLKGHHCERSGNEGRIIDNRKVVTDVMGNTRIIGSMKRVHGSGMRGTSDLKTVINSKFVAIEIKCEATKDRIRPDQLKYKESIEQAGGLYVIAKDFSGFHSWYNQTFKG
jgi:hypothetical protein